MPGNYFKKEIRLHMFSLEYEDASDFYLGSWQSNRSCVPLLLLRMLICIGYFIILLFTILIMQLEYWFLFFTIWGLILNTISSALAVTVSTVELLKGPDSNPRTLVKLHWAVFNASISIAFFITVFRFTLFGMTQSFFMVLVDVSQHLSNSVMMFCLLIASRQPTRLLHFYFPVVFGIAYLLFTLIYYLAGGLCFNKTWIYPNLDWSQPTGTFAWVVISVTALIVIHFIVVGMTLCRDALTKRCREPTAMSVSNTMNETLKEKK